VFSELHGCNSITFAWQNRKRSGSIRVRINEKKIAGVQRWDGLKWYLTNVRLSALEVIEQHEHF